MNKGVRCGSPIRKCACDRLRESGFATLSFVMPALVAGIHVFYVVR
jgi:hypothetical protein